MHREIRNDISTVREEARAEIGALWDEILQKMEALRNTHTQTANEQKEMGNSLSDATDRIAVLEKSHDMLMKNYKKLQEKCTDLENRSFSPPCLGRKTLTHR